MTRSPGPARVPVRPARARKLHLTHFMIITSRVAGSGADSVKGLADSHYAKITSARSEVEPLAATQRRIPLKRIEYD